MKKTIPTISTLVFLTCFALVTTNVVNAKTNTGASMRVSSHPNFNQKFSGNTFVLDGDSLKVGGKEVRLYMIDAPEYSQTCFNAKKVEYGCGQKSRDFLINLAGGKRVECVYAERDKYNRYLSKCSVDSVSINEAIIKNGMAVIYSFGEEDEKMEKFEAEAKKKKLGIWQGAFQLPKDYRKQNPRGK